MTQNPPGDATDAHGKYASCCLRSSARKESQAALCSHVQGSLRKSFFVFDKLPGNSYISPIECI